MKSLLVLALCHECHGVLIQSLLVLSSSNCVDGSTSGECISAQWHP
jgi:hypothetical protein